MKPEYRQDVKSLVDDALSSLLQYQGGIEAGDPPDNERVQNAVGLLEKAMKHMP